ncbi:MAG: T9SS type A sorting domain-containing protein [Flavobacteriales bacterium]|nr:T9SS type A sorting domain-containing protein [Flavobacteriales bacterium]
MKVKLLILVLVQFILNSTASKAQWNNIGPGKWWTLLDDVHFVNSSTGFATGLQSLIRTTDGGATWDSLSALPLGSTYSKVYFIDANTGFASSDNGVIYKTTDGGDTWSSATAQNACYVSEIDFFNSATGLAASNKQCSFDGIIYKTTDGGVSWVEKSLPSFSGILYDVQCLDNNIAYTTGYGGSFYKTTDAGETWTDLLINNGIPALNCLYFLDENTGWVAGDDSTLLFTQDGGVSWTHQTVGTAFDIFDISFVNSSTGYVIGTEVNTNTGIILKTTDGGQTWVSEYNQFDVLVAMSITPDNTVFVASGLGYVLKNSSIQSIDAINGEANYSLYPNPFVNKATFEFDNSNMDNHSLTIYDAQGQVVRILNGITSDNIDIERAEFNSGMYLFQLRNDKEIRAAGKMIVR